MDKHGQGFMIGILILVMSIILFIAMLPALKDIVNVTRGCDSFNCAGYIDPDASGAACTATNQSYTSTLEQDKLGCVMIGLVNPYLIIGVLVVAIALLMRNKLAPTPEPDYASYASPY